ncbi:hypothetical protein [Burkholderia glumae]|uniref:hypothetical protein n=1 Tax=Burkholderia glumae TaxID=337 RepID=UPI00215135DE|nr:hypothetical protein [Burkholderia glumae]
MELRERLNAVAKEYNEAIDKGKKRAAHEVAKRTHDAVCSAIKEIESSPSVDGALLNEAEALLMDIRWGQKTSRFT